MLAFPECLFATRILHAPVVLNAHLVLTGMGPICDGILHFVLSPEDFLPVIALAFFAGLRGPKYARLLCLTVPLAWFAGGLLAMINVGLPPIALSGMNAGLFLIAGGLLASNLELPLSVGLAVGILLGLSRGIANLAGINEGSARFLTLQGLCTAVFVVFAISASLTLPLKRFWIITVARVSGSWLVALGLLLAGWIWRYGTLIH